MASMRTRIDCRKLSSHLSFLWIWVPLCRLKEVAQAAGISEEDSRLRMCISFNDCQSQEGLGKVPSFNRTGSPSRVLQGFGWNVLRRIRTAKLKCQHSANQLSQSDGRSKDPNQDLLKQRAKDSAIGCVEGRLYNDDLVRLKIMCC